MSKLGIPNVGDKFWSDFKSTKYNEFICTRIDLQTTCCTTQLPVYKYLITRLNTGEIHTVGVAHLRRIFDTEKAAINHLLWNDYVKLRRSLVEARNRNKNILRHVPNRLGKEVNDAVHKCQIQVEACYATLDDELSVIKLTKGVW